MKFIAKKDTWFKEGTEAKLIDYYYTADDGDQVGLFQGIRVCEHPPAEANFPIGSERDDQEVCCYSEFEILDE